MGVHIYSCPSLINIKGKPAYSYRHRKWGLTQTIFHKDISPAETGLAQLRSAD